MASIAFEEYKNKLNNIRPALDDLGGALHLDEARNEVEKLEEESAQDGFWNDTENSQRVQKRIKTLKHKLERYEKLSGAWEDMLTMCEMAIEEDDDSMLPDLESEFHSFEETLESMRLSSARRHRPPSLKYSGYIEVLWKPSGATPSAGASAVRASGAFARDSASKSGWRYAGN